ncbi:MAG TPA: hypothetical protein VHO24_11215 [Opitutaceae bacterium]|nr:hypothetical protein [Opitutaceae bacterium]
MKSARCFLAWVVFGACVVAQAEPVVVPMLGPRYKQTRERIEVLFRYRNGDLPPLDTSVNLFRIAPHSSAPPELPQTKVEEPAPPDEMILKLAVATLKAGTVTARGRSYLVINKKQYEEGDFIPTLVRGKTVRLLLKRVSQNTATLSYNGVEMVASF